MSRSPNRLVSRRGFDEAALKTDTHDQESHLDTWIPSLNIAMRVSVLFEGLYARTLSEVRGMCILTWRITYYIPQNFDMICTNCPNPLVCFCFTMLSPMSNADSC